MNLQKYTEITKLCIRPEIYTDQSEQISASNRVIRFLIKELKASFEIPESIKEKRRLLRGLLNRRMPGKIPADLGILLNRILWTERVENGIIEVKDIPEVWKGDITQLNADVIVNAANSDMLGCFHPLHACIDNAIHSAAGPQLREDCNEIIKLQGAKEKTGKAKITRAYNLPSKYVIHTVGPIVDSAVSAEHKALLESCYNSCLDLASEQEDIRSIAFCCISTGVFGYPKEKAAATAILTVKKWTEKNPGKMDRIIFNVFTEEDYEIYQRHI